jgi:hypothetical protein
VRRLAALALLAGALALAACAGGGDDSGPFVASDSDAPFIPVLVSNDTAVGDVRLILTLDGRDGPAGIPTDASLTVRLLDVIPIGFRFRSQAEPERVQGPDIEYLVAELNFDHAGFWAIEVVATLADGERLASGRLAIQIDDEPDGLRPGDRAISSATGTKPGAPLRTVSIDDALARGQAFVIVFATLEACPRGGLCARAVAQVEQLSAETGVVGIHVSPLKVEADGALLPSPSGVLNDWQLASDPWIFVVDGNGVIAHSWELIVSDAALRGALQEVSGS